MRAFLSEFLASPAGTALLGAVLVAFADFATGVWAAAADGTFALDALAAFLRKHILGRVAPLATLLLLGYYGPPNISEAFLVFAITGLTSYAIETAASIKANIRPPADSVSVARTAAAKVNPVPTD